MSGHKMFPKLFSALAVSFSILVSSPVFAQDNVEKMEPVIITAPRIETDNSVNNSTQDATDVAEFEESEFDKADPLKGLNEGIYGFNDAVDKALLKPLATGYNTIMPDPLNQGISNFFSNVNDVSVVINDLLQLKLGQGASDFMRLVLNSTVGILGLFDVASEVGLPKHNEDFGQTLAHWGVGTGPYIVLPILGPSTLRDTVGWVVDHTAVIAGVPMNPIPVIAETNTAQSILYTTDVVDTRAGLVDKEKVLEAGAIDEYTFIRDSYLQKRKSLVLDGNVPLEEYPFEDEEKLEN